MDLEVFSNINKIIERDSKNTTYKFALLRGVIDIIQDNSPFIQVTENQVSIPMGLLIEKWMLYYYPIFQSQIPQIHGKDRQLAFAFSFQKLIQPYEHRGGFSAFYNDLKNKGIPKDIQPLFYQLSKSIRDTIVKMPMKFIGQSISKTHYSIFSFEPSPLKSKSIAGMADLILHFGTFHIPLAYYNAFKVLGNFINGQDSILFKWAEFSAQASQQSFSVHQVLDEVLKSPITLREIAESKKLYKALLQKEGTVYCVWTGKKIAQYDIDHLIPFSIWKNNDLWNLLPSDPRINQQKKDSIPTPNLIEKRKDLILNYWGKIYDHQPDRFTKEIQTSLLGHKPSHTWATEGINQLKDNCHYLIESRGFEQWEWKS